MVTLKRMPHEKTHNIWPHLVCKVEVKVNNPIIGLNRPIGLLEFEAPRFQDNRHMKVVRLSAVCTDHLYPPGNSWYSFLLEAESTSGPQCGRNYYAN